MNSADEEMHKQQTTEYGEKEGVLLPITFHNYFQTEWYFRMEDYERALQYYHGREVGKLSCANSGQQPGDV